MPARLTRDEQIERMTEVHDGYYNYGRWGHPGAMGKSTITCPAHGDFEQSYAHHTSNRGCPQCGHDRQGAALRMNRGRQIETLMIIHQGKYTYEKWGHPKAYEKSIITCPAHGDFEQRYAHHYQGHGCPECGVINCGPSKGHLEVRRILTEVLGYVEGEDFIEERPLPGTRYKFDFYLVPFSLYIEVQGLQHYEPVEFYGGEKNFKKKVRNDRIKKDWVVEIEENYLAIPYRNKRDLEAMEEILLDHLESLRR